MPRDPWGDSPDASQDPADATDPVDFDDLAQLDPAGPPDPHHTPRNPPPHHPPAPPPHAAHPAGIAQGGVYCMGCGFDLSGTPLGGACPECGRPVAASLPTAGGLPVSGQAVASLVLGIISIVSCGCVMGMSNIITGPLALIFGYNGLKAANEHKVSPSSRGLAIAGMITGGIGLALSGIGWLFVLIGSL
jgi:hypothetical protein